MSKFKKGDRVRYVPLHAGGNPEHPDCEDGVVKRVSDFFVFVIYDNAAYIMTTGDEPFTAQSTAPEDLILLDRQVYRAEP